MTPERVEKLRQTLKKRQPDFTLITDQVNKQQNLAAMQRTADAVGIPKIHTVWPEENYRKFNGSSGGSSRWVSIKTHKTVEAGISHLQQQGLKIYAAHFSDKAVDYRTVDFTLPCALLMGAEKEGVSDKGAEMADEHIIIPMIGMVASYNVSVAAAIILNEAQSQRAKAGLYEQQRLPQAEYDRLFFEWAHPKITLYCKNNKLPYPPLREDGEIENPAAWYQKVRENR